MLNRRFTEALEHQTRARKRLAVAEEKLATVFLGFLRQDCGTTSVDPSRPCINVTPPKQRPKK